MDFRAQDNEMRTSGSLGYATTHHHLPKESSAAPSSAAAASGGGGEKRRVVGIHNGTSNYNSSGHHHQTLDNHHIQPVQLHPCSDPDRVPGPGALSGTPVGGGPKSVVAKSAVRYRECLKNHAANIGGNVFDGCGEFMPSGDEGTLEALKCAACDCHRNFHRKEVDGETTAFSPGSRRSSRSLMLTPLQLPPPLPSPSSALHQHHHHHHQKYQMAPIIQPMSVAYGGGGTESSSEDLNVFGSNNADGGGMGVPPFSMTKKRFRTKFTADQKERMTEFAERVGWRMQKQDDAEVERFCAEVGVKRQVFRVWMHNNKAGIGKRASDVMASGGSGGGGGATTSLSFENVEAEGGGEGGAEADI